MDYIFMALTVFFGWVGLDCAGKDKLGTAIFCASLSGVFFYQFLKL